MAGIHFDFRHYGMALRETIKQAVEETLAKRMMVEAVEETLAKRMVQQVAQAAAGPTTSASLQPGFTPSASTCLLENLVRCV
jgi:phage baseplate assembly protein W